MKGLYIHLPFCTRKKSTGDKCIYCDFPSFVDKQQHIDLYILRLVKEMQFYSRTKIDTIYVGGGTPSILSPKQTERLFVNLYRTFNSKALKEISWEANPGTLNRDKLQVLKQCGVTRLSLGVQTLNYRWLRWLGRDHSFVQVKKNFELACKVGFKNISLDLIFGFPGQTYREWQDDLSAVVKFNPDHLSVYNLTIESQTVLANLVKQKKIILNSEEDDRKMYDGTIDFLARHNFRQYEISNFYRYPTGEPCLHNLNYWQNGEYIGVGLSACSYLKGKRIYNTSQWDKYMVHPFKRNNIISEIDITKGKEKIAEQVILGLRLTAGLYLNPVAIKLFSPILYQLAEQNLVDYTPPLVKLTRNGLFLSNYVFRALL